VARITGTSGNDSLVGTPGADTIEGLGGNDTLDGNGGSDFLNGGTGNDRYRVDGGDTLTDAGGIDTVESTVSWTLGGAFENLTLIGTAPSSGSGNSLNNVITGNSAANWLRGLAGNDTVSGGEGNDTINMSFGSASSYGSDVIDGGGGVDTLDFGDAARSAVRVDLAAGTASGGGIGGAGSASVSGIENVNGSAFDDRITGNAASNFLFGYLGNDTLDGGAGVDRLDGSLGNDTYIVTAGDMIGDAGGIDHVISNTSWTLQDGLENLTIITAEPFAEGEGNGLDNQLRGVGDDIRLYGRAGDDRLQAESRFSILEGNEGSDTLIGARGGFDNMFGGAGNDVLDDRLDDIPAAFSAGGANFDGGAGDDTIFGGAADDLVQLFGGNYGRDSIDGGGGRDSVSFESAESGVVVNLAAGTAGTATVVRVENAYGGTFDDRITGNSGANVLSGAPFFGSAFAPDGNDTLFGLAGHDTLLGGNGNDWLQGGTWSDTLTGGAGADSFVWAEAGTNHVDRVTDFTPGFDELLFENATLTALGEEGAWAPGDERFHSAPGATSGQEADDRLVYNNSTGSLYYDPDGSGSAAAQIVAVFQGAPAITASDITVI
jgi:Ca2+-binding RTX toxin-like protein